MGHKTPIYLYNISIIILIETKSNLFFGREAKRLSLQVRKKSLHPVGATIGRPLSNTMHPVGSPLPDVPQTQKDQSRSALVLFVKSCGEKRSRCIRVRGGVRFREARLQFLPRGRGKRAVMQKGNAVFLQVVVFLRCPRAGAGAPRSRKEGGSMCRLLFAACIARAPCQRVSDMPTRKVALRRRSSGSPLAHFDVATVYRFFGERAGCAKSAGCTNIYRVGMRHPRCLSILRENRIFYARGCLSLPQRAVLSAWQYASCIRILREIPVFSTKCIIFTECLENRCILHFSTKIVFFRSVFFMLYCTRM